VLNVCQKCQKMFMVSQDLNAPPPNFIAFGYTRHSPADRPSETPANLDETRRTFAQERGGTALVAFRLRVSVWRTMSTELIMLGSNRYHATRPGDFHSRVKRRNQIPKPTEAAGNYHNPDTIASSSETTGLNPIRKLLTAHGRERS